MPSSANRLAPWSACKIAEWPPVPFTRFSKIPPASTATRRRCASPPATAMSRVVGTEYRDAAEEIAAGLRALGIGKGDVVALNSETRLEFYLADLGIVTNGSVAAAMYPSYPAADLVRTIEHSGARAVFVEDPKTLKSSAAGARGALDSAHRRGRRRAHAGRTALPRTRRNAARPGTARPHPQRSRRRRCRHPVSHQRRHRRTQDGAGHPWRHRLQHRDGAGRAAARPARCTRWPFCLRRTSRSGWSSSSCPCSAACP